MQSRRASAIESVTNLIAGMGISWCLAAWFLPLFGYTSSTQNNAVIVSVYTVASMVRTYAVRRVFNKVT